MSLRRFAKSLYPSAPTMQRTKAAPAASETAECLAFIQWTELVSYCGRPLFYRVVKIPNERGKAGIATAILTSIGMKKGFPDYNILAPCGEWHGLYLEAKKKVGGKVDQDQLDWKFRLREFGYWSEICDGADELILATKDYFYRNGAIADGRFVDRTRFTA